MAKQDFRRINEIIANEVDELIAVLNLMQDVCCSAFESLSEAIESVYAAKRTIFFCGNGGSAAECQHLAAELVIRYKRDRPPISSIALTTDSSVLTACANDYSYEEIFARQILALGRKGDILICLSTSGSSSNILRGAQEARNIGIITALLTSELYLSSAADKSLFDITLVAPTTSVSLAQAIHLIVGHSLCDFIEQIPKI